jgi:curved DNA-binding protein
MDYYQILGVDRSSTPEQIKQAYRKLASKHHPDKGGDTVKFQQIEEAYRTLSDPQRRSEYDNPPQQFSGFPGGFQFDVNGVNPFEEILNQFTRQQRQPRQRAYSAIIFVTLEQIATGSVEAIQLNTDQGPKTFQIRIPAGVEDGQRIRYDGLIPDGPLLITFRTHKHPTFERRGLDLVMSCDVSVFDLILGTTLTVPTIRGQTLEVTVHPRTKPGATLRIPNHGLETSNRRGDQFILINPTIPDTISDEVLQVLEQERNSK